MYPATWRRSIFRPGWPGPGVKGIRVTGVLSLFPAGMTPAGRAGNPGAGHAAGESSPNNTLGVTAHIALRAPSHRQSRWQAAAREGRRRARNYARFCGKYLQSAARTARTPRRGEAVAANELIFVKRGEAVAGCVRSVEALWISAMPYTAATPEQSVPEQRS